MMADAIDRYAGARTPPRPPETRVGTPPPGRSVKPTRLRYKSMGADHLVCRTWDGVNEGATDILVAKPYLLRRTTARTGYAYYYTNDYTRLSVKSADGTEENQVIVPAYEVNQEIFAMGASTGMTVGSFPSTQTVGMIDLNLDARAWAKAAS